MRETMDHAVWIPAFAGTTKGALASASDILTQLALRFGVTM
jgi:hypothetical protein